MIIEFVLLFNMKIDPKNVPYDGIIIDVLSDSHYGEVHIKGAQNFCVYETAFLKKVNEAIPDKNSELCLYGYNDETEEVTRAQNILSSDGYVNVCVINGGLKGWIAEGLPVESGERQSHYGGLYRINVLGSRLEWTGRNIGNKHSGLIDFTEGFVKIINGDLVEGRFAIDMNSVKNLDQESPLNGYLEAHLKSDDFFDVANFPEASIFLLESVKCEGLISKENYKIKAALTIKGIVNEIEFLAFIHEKGDELNINAHFDIDRTKWDVKYGSEKFFSKLGMHLIDDNISFDMIIKMKKE